MFGRKMRNRVTALQPNMETLEEKTIDPAKVKGKQKEMKKRFEWSKSPTTFDIRVGDYVRVKGKDEWMRDY